MQDLIFNRIAMAQQVYGAQGPLPCSTSSGKASPRMLSSGIGNAFPILGMSFQGIRTSSCGDFKVSQAEIYSSSGHAFGVILQRMLSAGVGTMFLILRVSSQDLIPSSSAEWKMCRTEISSSPGHQKIGNGWFVMVNSGE